MPNSISNKFILTTSVLLSLIVVAISIVGLFTPDFYSVETPNWQAQSIGQDMIDLFFIVPCLILSGLFAYRGNKTALSIWGGVVFYLTYTFVLYCFDVHFNRLFILYCMCLGLSFYSSIYFLISQYQKKESIGYETNSIFRFTGIYFIVIAILFYLLWLMEIVLAIVQKITPKSIMETGLFTNGVHVMDLAIFLPGIFLTGLFLFRRKPLGFILTPPLLTFFILMDITIGALGLVMRSRGLESNPLLTIVMSVLALVSLILLILFFRKVKAIL